MAEDHLSTERTVPLTSGLSAHERELIDQQIARLRMQLEATTPDELSLASPARRDHTSLLVGSTMAIAIVAVIAIVVIYVMRPDKDNSSLVATLLGFLVPVMTALLAAAVQQVSLAVNGRLSQLLRATAAKSQAEGRAEGLLLAQQTGLHHTAAAAAKRARKDRSD